MNTVLAAIDFSTTSNQVVEQASTLARELHAKLWIVHVASDETQTMVYETSQYSEFSPEMVSIPGDVQMTRDLSAEELKREHRELLGISSGLKEEGIDAQAILLKGDASRLIVEKAEEFGADIIVLGSHGHGLLHKALLGSVSEYVMRHATCNVMIIPTPEK